MPAARADFSSPLRTEANGSLVCHSGCWGASCLMRSKANNAWKNVGCSAQSVPSLSNTVMRSAIGTNSGEPGLVTVVTNSAIDRLAGPSFHDGNGSAV